MRISDWSSDVCSSDLDSRRFPEIRIKHEERVSDPQTSSSPGFYLYAIGDERSPRAIFPRSRRAHECSVFRRSCVEWPRNWCSPSAADPNRVERQEEHTYELQ